MKLSVKSGIDSCDKFFFQYAKKIGFKLIPKCGSTSVRLGLGMSESPPESGPDRFLECPRRVVVLRHPADRLRSVYTAFIQGNFLAVLKSWNRKYGVHEQMTLEEFLDLVLGVPDIERDWHWQSVSYQVHKVRDMVTDWVDIAHWDRYSFLPPLDFRLNGSKPDVLATTRWWTPEEERRIIEEFDEDYALWERAIRG